MFEGPLDVSRLTLDTILRIELDEMRYQAELAAWEADRAACAPVRAALSRRRVSQLELAQRRQDPAGEARARAQLARIDTGLAGLPDGYPALVDEWEPTRRGWAA